MSGDPTGGGDPRLDGRSNVFLGAILRVGSKSWPVRIRNLSVNGALLDGGHTPKESEKVSIERGSLIASGSVAWSRDGHAGIRFDEVISIADWVKQPGHDGQRRVDMVVAALREGKGDIERARQTRLHRDPKALRQYGIEIQRICECIIELPAMSAELAEEVGKLEAIAQSLLSDCDFSP